MSVRAAAAGAFTIVIAAGLGACASGGGGGLDPAGGGERETVRVSRGLDASERSVSRSSIDGSGVGAGAVSAGGGGGTALTVGGRAIDWSAVRVRLVEASGADVLEELVLDAALEARAARAGVALDAGALDRERALLIQGYIDAGLARDRAEGERLIGEVRRTRGLGDQRFAALLERNALLRALVRDRVVIDESALERAYALRHGPRYRVRLLTTATMREASQAAARVRGGEAFSRVAAEVSTDPSGARGGVVEPISAEDISYPESLRRVLPGLGVGQVSPAIALDNGYAVVVVDAVVGPGGGDWSVEQARQPAPASVREELVAMERLRQERLLMDQLAREVLGEGANAVRFEDPDLARAWRAR